MFSKLIITIIRGYQRFISPLLGQRCRFHPTCSSYMIEAVRVHGAFKGTIMGIGRILRCNPFVKGGIDYVPAKFSLCKNPDEHYIYYKSYKKNH